MGPCKTCDEPLVVHLDQGEDGGGEGQVPDDLELQCGCHFHWQCLMDDASLVSASLRCPACNTYLPVNEAGASSTTNVVQAVVQAPTGATIFADYTNEGGLQHNLDILPSIKEEAYVQNNPGALPARALHVMCAEGDVEGMVELLRDIADQDAADSIGSIVRYQDPLADMKSGLHLAIQHMHEEVAWLLLWLSSTLSTASFPDPIRRAVESAGVGRMNVGIEEDIRSLRDNQGRTVEQLAGRLQGPWSMLLEAGLFSP